MTVSITLPHFQFCFLLHWPRYVTEPTLHWDLPMLQSLPFTETYIRYRASPSLSPTYVTEPALHRDTYVTEPPLHPDLRKVQSLPFTETYVRYRASPSPRPTYVTESLWLTLVGHVGLQPQPEVLAAHDEARPKLLLINLHITLILHFGGLWFLK